MDLLMAGFQHNLLCHICSSSSHLPLFFLEAALLSCFASSLSSIALMHLVRLRVSKSQLSHFWIIEPSRFWVFLNFFFPCNPTSLFFPLEPPLFYPPVFFLCTFYDGSFIHIFSVCPHDCSKKFMTPRRKEGVHTPLNPVFVLPWNMPGSPRDSYTCHARLSVVTLGIRDLTVPSGSTSISPSLPLLNRRFHHYVWGQSTKIKQQLSRSGLLKLAVWCASVWLISQLQVPERLSF